MIELIYETLDDPSDTSGWLPGELSEAARDLALELGARRRDLHDRRPRECDYGERGPTFSV